jgi:hypothetical protein
MSLILDLDKTLIHSIRIPDIDTFDKQESCGSYGTELESGHITFKRPNVDRFLRWCFRKFEKVILWSAGTTGYVHEILLKMFDEFKFDLVFTRDHCTFPCRKDFSNPLIKQLMTKHGIEHQTVTYFVDDKLYRIQNASTHNVKLIQITPFVSKWDTVIGASKKRKRPIREQDNSLLDLRKRLTIKS